MGAYHHSLVRRAARHMARSESLKEGDFEAAKAMMDQSRIALNEAHLAQTKLIEGDQAKRQMKVSLSRSRSGSFDDPQCWLVN